MTPEQFFVGLLVGILLLFWLGVLFVNGGVEVAWFEAWGSWVGGLASFAAVGAALWISSIESRRARRDRAADREDRAKLATTYLTPRVAQIRRLIDIHRSMVMDNDDVRAKVSGMALELTLPKMIDVELILPYVNSDENLLNEFLILQFMLEQYDRWIKQRHYVDQEVSPKSFMKSVEQYTIPLDDLAKRLQETMTRLTGIVISNTDSYEPGFNASPAPNARPTRPRR